MYSVIIGLLVTLIVGYLMSYILQLLKLQNNARIYVEGSIKEINVALFSPPIARSIRRKFEKK